MNATLTRGERERNVSWIWSWPWCSPSFDRPQCDYAWQRQVAWQAKEPHCLHLLLACWAIGVRFEENVLFTVRKTVSLQGFHTSLQNTGDQENMITSREPQTAEVPVYCKLAGLSAVIREGSLSALLWMFVSLI